MPDLQGAIHPTIFIGLGGTGKEILLRLRRRFYEKWRGQTGLPCMGYLWIDTDSRDVLAMGERIDEIDVELKFEEHEKFGLLQKTVGEDLGPLLRDKKRHSYIHDWLFPEVEQFGCEIGNGAGAVRSIGRLTFFNHFERVRDLITRIRDKVTDLPQRNATARLLPDATIHPEAQVYLIFSVAGGTGSGIFLDMAFLLRKMNFRDITGIVALPNVYFPTNHGEEAGRAYGNSYSALKELEFFTRRIKQVANAGDGMRTSIDYEVNWTGTPERPPIPGPPFSVAYLCEMRNEQGIGAGRRHELFHMIADSLFVNFLPDTFSTQKRSRLANTYQLLAARTADWVPVAENVQLVQSFSRRYASMGMSKIEVPVEMVREGCASELTAEIFEYWARPGANPNLKGALDQAMRNKFDEDGLESWFGKEWSKTIQSELAKILPPDLPAEGPEGSVLKAFVHELPEKLQKFKDAMTDATGTTPARWGSITQILRNTRGKAAQDLCDALKTWTIDCLEQPDLGLRAVAGSGDKKEFQGMLPQLMHRFQQFYKDNPSGAELRKQQIQAEAEEWDRRQKQFLDEMTHALGSMPLKMLGSRMWTLKRLYNKLQEAAEQHVKALAAVILTEEAAKIAAVAYDYLADRQKELERFRDSLPGVISDMRKLRADALDMGVADMIIRVFDQQRDFPKFYVLDFDERSRKHLPVNPEKEQRRFLDSLRDRASLLDAIQFFLRNGAEELRQGVRQYANRRFQDDFQICRNDPHGHADCGRMVEVLTHPQIQADTHLVDRFVTGAMPMLRRGNRLSGDQTVKPHVYLRIAATDRQPYSDFIRELKNKLTALGFEEPSEQATDDPTSVQLLIETYAFPLPTADIIVRDCHEAYYNFYHSGAAQFQKQKNKIPLHLRKEWEGEFEDLRPVDESTADEIFKAIQVLSLGVPLRILRLVVNPQQRREYEYRKWVPPMAESEYLGHRQQAIEFLIRERKRRDDLLAAIHVRMGQLTQNNPAHAETLFWSFTYMNLAVFLDGTPEHRIVADARQEIYKRLTDAGSQIEDLAELNVEQSIEACKKKLGDAVEWVDGIPVLKAVKPLVLGRSDSVASA